MAKRMRGVMLALLGGMLLAPAGVRAQTLVEGRNRVFLHGRPQEVYFLPAPKIGLYPKGTILFAPGDGGWRGFAITLAQTMASWDYDVYGLDTKVYLEGAGGKNRLRERDVMADFAQLAAWIQERRREPILLVGWSEGAGLCLLAAASPDNKDIFSGLLTLGLPEINVLALHWSDIFSELTGSDPREPKFQSRDYLPQLAPLPLLMIQSSGDQYVSVPAARQLFAAAGEPKRFALIPAQNHRFDGNHQELFLVIREGLLWAKKTSP